MDDRKFVFLKAVLGDDGATALRKASSRSEELEGAIIPRAIMAWLGIAGRGNFEGSLPGIDDSYLDFEKNEDGTYTGSIAIGDGVFPFRNASIFHLAASISLAIGAGDSEVEIKDIELVRLGKSIDILAKAKFVSDEMNLAKAIPGPPHAPTQQNAPAQAVAPMKQIDKGPKIPGRKPKKPATEAKIPKHKIPKQEVKLPRVQTKTFNVPAAAAKAECTQCGLPLIKKERFTGCVCYHDVARFVTLTKNIDSGNYSITFAKELDEEAVSSLLHTLGVSHA